jgi:hypothetical protein
MEITLIFLWIILTIITGTIGSSREIGGSAFLLSLFFSPLWTKKYIYSVLPQGVLQALLTKTPRNEKGQLTRRLHQKLTREQGIDHLNKQLVSVSTLMSISDSWNGFDRLWNKKFGQQELAFKEFDLLEPPKPTLSDFNKKLITALNYNPKKDKPKDDSQTELFN